MQSRMIYRQAKQMSMVALLAQFGFTPTRIKGKDYWYCSPFRDESTASFKVNSDRNIYFDHGEGTGGNIIDFAARYFHCLPNDAVKKLLEFDNVAGFSFHQQPIPAQQAGEKKETNASKTSITKIRTLQDKSLLDYLNKRKIPVAVAKQFCKEVDFGLYGKQYRAIGFQNRSDGFELRSERYKGSSSPKDITFFANGELSLYVFEGFFDFLSLATIRPHIANSANCLVLNSLAFFDQSRSMMEDYDNVHLLLDWDPSGRKATGRAMEWNKEMGQSRYSDASGFYKDYQDVNGWLVASFSQQQALKPNRRSL